MTIRTRLVIAAVAITCTIATIAHATPIVGLLVSTILSSGTINDEIRMRVHVPLPPVVGANSEDNEDQDNEWRAELYTSGPSNIVVQDVVYAPGGHTGWHSHPGILLSSVISGSIEWYDSRCRKHVYNAGDSLTESTQTHYVRNVEAVNAHFMVTYLIANGQPRRIDQPAPACAAALGLD
ncbi:MAG TPA: cupin domain-containing protein [Terriglobia bacterium]|nr:cupin domain-containing protein [Terriglobia bacterium]